MELQRIWREGYRAWGKKRFPCCGSGKSNRRSGKAWGRKIFRGSRYEPRYNLRGERSDKDFSSYPRPGGENSTGKLPKFKVRETPAEGITIECDEKIGVPKG
jgi:hypothetical protein